MKRQPLQLASDGARLAVFDRPEPREQRHRGVDRIGVRRFEPFERSGIAAPGKHVQDRRGQIDAVDVGLAMWTKPIAPESCA